MKTNLHKHTPLILFAAVFVLVGCGGAGAGGGTTTGNPFTEDTSATGTVAGAVGGALSGTSTTGSQAFEMRPPEAAAQMSMLRESALVTRGQLLKPSSGLDATGASVCPTFRSTNSSVCDVSGSSMLLSYADCKFAGSGATWLGTLALTPSAGAPVCGSFPNPGANGTLYRQYVTSSTSNTPGQTRVTSKYGTVITIDDQSANLGNYDNASIPVISNAGYGASVSFDGTAARTSVTLGHHISASTGADHSVSGTLGITEVNGAGSREINGTVTVYHNQLRVTGSSYFDHVVHNDQCCLPVSGTITTTFAQGANTPPTTLGMKIVGKAESLTFTSCGVATLQSYDGTTSTVSLSKCY